MNTKLFGTRNQRILILLLLTSIVFMLFQFEKNNRYETYLNNHLSESFNSLSHSVFILNAVTSKVMEENEVTRISLNEIKNHINNIQQQSLEVVQIARDLHPKKADILSGITHNTAHLMDTRVTYLIERIDVNDSMVLEEVTSAIISLIQDTSTHWDREFKAIFGHEINVNNTDWIDTMIAVEEYSEYYQKRMD